MEAKVIPVLDITSPPNVHIDYHQSRGELYVFVEGMVVLRVSKIPQSSICITGLKKGDEDAPKQRSS